MPLSTTSASLRTVSVVRMASAAAVPPRRERPATASGTPPWMRSMGSGIPISPVEHTSTSSGRHPIPAATAAQVASASARPRAPVAALALPLLSTTAAARPPVAARCARLTSTGAAVALFRVNTATAVTGRPSSVATRARSSSPPALIPQATPEATNPSAPVTVTDTSRPPEGRWSRAGRGPGWRTAAPVPTLP